MAPKKQPEPMMLTTDHPDTIEERQKREAAALGVLDARLIRRTGRTIPVMMKTTPIKKHQHQQLMLRMGGTMTDAYEAALDALQEKLDAQEGKTDVAQ